MRPSGFAVAAVITITASAAPITVLSDTTTYRVLRFPNQSDYYNEARVTNAAADIIGNTQHAAFYTASDGAYTYFRVRLGTYRAAGYNAVVWVGIDADSDGGPDLFIALNNRTTSRAIQFHSARSGPNLTPATTGVLQSTAVFRYNYTPGVDYHYAPVGPTLEPGIGLNLNLDNDASNDAFLTFGVRLYNTAGSPSIQGALSALAGIDMTPTTRFRYLVATATRDNAINLDIAGLPNTYSNQSTWQQLGGLSEPVHASGIPEGDTWILMAAGLTLLTIGYRRRR